MSVESRSVANDLIRLEMQLAMVGAKAGDNVVKKELELEAKKRNSSGVGNGSSSVQGNLSIANASSGGASLSQRNSNRTVTTITKRVKKTVEAPPGKLGIILANKTDSRGTVVSGVRTNSVLFDKIIPGDRIVAIDGEDVSRMSVSEITTIMSRKSDFDRTLTVLTNPKQQQDTILGAY
jgi:C-terminal processing protease CtpA/Prc